MPPPSTRLNSVNPVSILEMFSVLISVIGFAAESGTACDSVRDVRPGAAVRDDAEGRASWNSSMVPHWPHSGQRTSLPYRRQYGYFGTIVFGDIKGVLVRDDGEITVSGFERLTDMKE